MVMSDDQSTGMLSKATMPKTTKEIVRQGTSFEQAIATTPTCCPSRASFITGQYAHNHGVLENDYGLLGDDTSTLPTWLQAAGYRTIHVGKYMNRFKKTQGAKTIAPGWDVFDAALEKYSYYDYALRLNGKTKRYGDEDEDYLTTVLNGLAVDEVTEAAGKRPFYMQYTPYAPHIAPGDKKRCDGAAVPAPEDMKLFEDEELPEPANFNEADVSDKPSFIQGLKELSAKKIADLERRYACALASLRELDRGVDDIIGALDDAGELEDTVLIFVSDNGFFYGEHRIPDAKQNPYEEALRIPLAMRIPPKFLGGDQAGEQGRRAGRELRRDRDDPRARGRDPVQLGRSLPHARRALAPGPRRRRARRPARRPRPRGRAEADRAERAGARRPRLHLHGRAHPDPRVHPPHRGAQPALARLRAGRRRRVVRPRGRPVRARRASTARRPGARMATTEAALAERSARLADCAGIEGRDPLPPSGHWCE